MALTFPQVVAHQMPRQNAQHHDSPPTVLADASACLRLGSEGLSLSLSPSPPRLLFLRSHVAREAHVHLELPGVVHSSALGTQDVAAPRALAPVSPPHVSKVILQAIGLGVGVCSVAQAQFKRFAGSQLHRLTSRAGRWAGRSESTALLFAPPASGISRKQPRPL